MGVNNKFFLILVNNVVYIWWKWLIYNCKRSHFVFQELFWYDIVERGCFSRHTTFDNSVTITKFGIMSVGIWDTTLFPFIKQATTMRHICNDYDRYHPVLFIFLKTNKSVVKIFGHLNIVKSRFVNLCSYFTFVYVFNTKNSIDEKKNQSDMETWEDNHPY